MQLFSVWQQQETATILVDVNGTQYTINTRASTVGAALNDAGIVIDAADKIDPVPESRIVADMTINITKARQLIVDVDGNVQRIYTHESDPLAIFAENNITFNETQDQLFINHRPYREPGNRDEESLIRHLRIMRGKSFQIIENNVPIVAGQSVASTVGELLAEYDITLYLADQIIPSATSPITEGITIEIVRSSPVTIEVDGTTIATRATGSTVFDVLTTVGLPLSGQDYTIPAIQADFDANMTINIIRVMESLEREEHPIAYETVMLPDPSMNVGMQRVIQVGETGIEVHVYRVRRENGENVSRIEHNTWVAQPPINHVVVYGTQ